MIINFGCKQVQLPTAVPSGGEGGAGLSITSQEMMPKQSCAQRLPLERAAAQSCLQKRSRMGGASCTNRSAVRWESCAGLFITSPEMKSNKNSAQCFPLEREAAQSCLQRRSRMGCASCIYRCALCWRGRCRLIHHFARDEAK